MSLFQQLLAALDSAPTQNQRLLKLHTPLGADVLLAERLHAVEAIGPAPLQPEPDSADAAPASGLRLVVHALAADTHLELKTLIGQPVLVELLTQASRTSLRPFHAHVTAAALLGSDGGLARYRLTLEPWLAFLGHRRDSFVFQDLTVVEIVQAVFADYAGQGRLAPAWRWQLADAAVYPKRSLCAQYQESDLDFVQRLLREEGLFHWWEHAGDASAAPFGSHTLVIADHNGAFQSNAQPRVRYTQSGAALPEDSLTRWREQRRVQAGALDLASLDYRTRNLRPVAQSGSDGLPDLALADIPGAYAYEDTAQGERLALRQMQAIDAQRQRTWAQGSWRSAAPASSFTLLDHPLHDGFDVARDTFVVLAVAHTARSNLGADVKAQVTGLLDAIALDQRDRDGVLANESDEPLYRCRLLAQPLALPVRMMALDARGIPDPRIHPRPTVHGVQTALVVGLAEPVHTDRDHRIKVQFHWQRGAAGSHRIDHPAGDDNAPTSDASGSWVRVAQTVAGANWGAVFTPRLGQEVLVSFVEGDIDRPVVVGVVYNGRGQLDAQHNQTAAGAAKSTGNAAAWFPGSQADGRLQGHRHPAVLSGYKSQELASSASGIGGSNQFVFDDSAGQGRIQASSSSAQTRLQLGHLLQQTDNQRLQPRGHGIDLATDAWGAVRAGSGLLLSAHGRPASTALARQLDSREPVAQLEQAQQLLHALAESAQQHKAKLEGGAEPDVIGAGVKDTARQLSTERALAASLDSLKATAQRGDVQGDEATTAGGGSGTVAAWSRPDLVAAAPGGVALLTPANAVFSAGNTTTLVAGQDLQHAAQRHHATAVKGGVVVYTYGKATNGAKPNTETGIALHAATGSVASHSLTAATNITADKSVEVSSTTAMVRVTAPKHVLLTAAGAAIRIEGGNITLTAPGKVEFRASVKELASGAAASRPKLNLPMPASLRPLCHERFQAINSASGKPVEGMPYRIELADGSVLRGRTDDDGRTLAVTTADPQSIHLFWEPEAQPDDLNNQTVEGC